MSDELGLTVRTLPTLERRSRARDLDALSAIVEDNDVKRLVVGLPLQMSGEPGKSASRAEQLGRTLSKRCGIELALWDERLSSVAAEELISMRDGRRGRKNIDSVAAAVILRSYLEGDTTDPAPAGRTKEPRP